MYASSNHYYLHVFDVEYHPWESQIVIEQSGNDIKVGFQPMPSSSVPLNQVQVESQDSINQRNQKVKLYTWPVF